MYSKHIYTPMHVDIYIYHIQHHMYVLSGAQQRYSQNQGQDLDMGHPDLITLWMNVEG